MDPITLYATILLVGAILGFLLWGLHDATQSLKDLTKDQENKEMHKSSIVYKGYTSSRS